MIIKQSPLGLQEGTSWEDRLKAVECLVCFIVGLVQFLAAMYLEDKGHNILRELLGDLFQLFLVSLVHDRAETWTTANLHHRHLVASHSIPATHPNGTGKDAHFVSTISWRLLRSCLSKE
jgi:hypothetical protein